GASAPAPVSVAVLNSRSASGNSSAPRITPDGRHVAFLSHAPNLVYNDDLGPFLDLFVRDLPLENTLLVSVATNGFGGANDDVTMASLSDDARFIAFESAASNLVPGDTNWATDVFVRDTLSNL